METNAPVEQEGEGRPEKLRRLAGLLDGATLTDADEFAYLVSLKWCRHFVSSVFAGQVDDVDVLDNTDLIAVDAADSSPSTLHLDSPSRFSPALRADLAKGRDFIVVSEQVWNSLSSLVAGGPEIRRQVSPTASGHFVEVYPAVITVKSTQGDVPIVVGKESTISALVELAAPKLGLMSTEGLRCYNFLGGERGELLDPNSSITACGLEMKQDIWLEVASQEAPASAPSTDNSRMTLSVSRGIVNVSNSCYVNSSMQALAHVSQFRAKLVCPSRATAPYLAEINMDNALGHKGAVVHAVSETLEALYSSPSGGQPRPVVPRSLLKVLGRLSHRFDSIEQQDAQELLLSLIDGIHEDVNRVKGPKPYHPDPVEADSLDPAILQEKSILSWKMHQERDDSFIVDMFQGQLQSQVSCDTCGKRSIRWEAYSSLVLPLPLSTKRQIRSLLVGFPRFGGAPTYVEVLVDNKACIADLVGAVCRTIEFSGSSDCDWSIKVADIYGKRVHKVFSDSDPVSTISPSDDIALYYVEVPNLQPQMLDYFIVPLNQRSSRPVWNPAKGVHDIEGRPCGLPVFIPVPISCGQVSRRFLHMIASKYISSVVNWNIPDSSCLNDLFTLAVVDRHGTTLAPVVDSLGIISGCTPTLAYPPGALLHVADSDATQKEWLALNWDISVKDVTSIQRPFNAFSAELPSTPKPAGGVLTLERCIHSFLATENLDSNNTWYCGQCKDHRTASKALSISRFPPVLLLTLKRFSSDPWGSGANNMLSALARSKLSHKVEFPLTLDLSGFKVDYSTQMLAPYTLVAVINHYGSVIGGHYTAYCREDNGKWYCFDDDSVTPISEDQLVSSAAYVLVYSSNI